MSAIESLTIYPARKIITMEEGFPEATAIAISGDRIVDLGSLESLQPWMDRYPYEINEVFADKVLMPGFFDPHLHPFLGATLLTFDMATPDNWELPGEMIEGCRTRKEFFNRVKSLHEAWPDKEKTHIIWGWHPLWHGKVTRKDLDEISSTDPLIVWHRSYHELVVNSVAFEQMALTDEFLEPYAHQVDIDNAHFYENGIAVIFLKLEKLLLSDEKVAEGLALYRKLAHMGGITSVCDLLGGGATNPEREWEQAKEHLDGDDVPFRTSFVPAPLAWRAHYGDDLFEKVQGLSERDTHRLRWPKAVKAFHDGAFISQYFMLSEPGYIDGHQGEWMTPPEIAYDVMEPFWKAGYDIFTHVNGDLGTELALDIFDRLQEAHPRRDYRYNLEHMGVARADQVRRMAAQKISVSVNGYFHQIFADKYAEEGLGPSRAAQITRIGDLARHGIPFTLHSDCPMGPIKPLWAVCSAVTRRTQAGNVLGEHQAVTLDQALRAITIDAAWTLRQDRDLGSLAAGKIADMAILEEDPYEVAPDDIKNISVWGTMFEGQVFPVEE